MMIFFTAFCLYLPGLWSGNKECGYSFISLQSCLPTEANISMLPGGHSKDQALLGSCRQAQLQEVCFSTVTVMQKVFRLPTGFEVELWTAMTGIETFSTEVGWHLCAPKKMTGFFCILQHTKTNAKDISYREHPLL